MSTTTKAFCWAAAIIAVAITGRVQLIPADSAQTLIIILPVLAAASLFKSRGCAMACVGGDRA
ncbi:hypothetical protein A9995_13115 [Erythrobacter sp. QSSC1-22B]|uniref:hypothetical protein n=1 Tax=Erythrobacter sp. QSSC1-22B TaxID=1860125 RepID=UPI000805086D|nr:hypothetical protein [Erythrobacter sp. QSSC1-22B]OBX18097.1 hypothetical protein A9995_13115 [Erythrobacter sp. QSSC1-22B]